MQPATAASLSDLRNDSTNNYRRIAPAKPRSLVKNRPVDSIELQLHLPAELSNSAAPSGVTRLEEANDNQITPPRPVNTSGKVLSSCTKHMEGLLAMLNSNSENSDSESRRRSISPCRDETAALDNACIGTLSTDLATNEALQLIVSGTITCRWKDCKKVDNTNGGSVFQASVLQRAGKTIKKATVPPPTGKKRVMWHNDEPSGDVSSLSVLIDWITDGDNCDRYRGGEEQNGETKVALAEQISRLVSLKGLKTMRTAKDITSKISSLESSYRATVDWLAATGQGVTDESTLR
ncbi:unnamed protein product [Phytophthora fragariaefolia]|uniref:Unnamed protein product n=1 Tax=Phytophthora fragariaefolia TaxID=1490495 RepID=A0A9W6X4E7_9STRA|nr:unnamed protein product [Phytophthora fragariaefolia]